MRERSLIESVSQRPTSSAKPRTLKDSQRMMIFVEIVQAQDEGLTVARSRARVAGKHRITIEQVSAIEAEGLAQSWAPL